MCSYQSSGKLWALAPHCSHALVHNLQPTSDRCLIFASYLATGMIPAIAIISRLLCLHRSHSTGRSNTSLRTLCFQFALTWSLPATTCHVPHAGWLALFCSALARTYDLKNFLSSIQVFCCKTFTMLCYDSSYRRMCVQTSMSSPLHNFSYRRLSVFICLQAPVSFFSCFCTSFSAATLRIASLTPLLNVEWLVTFPASQRSVVHVKNGDKRYGYTPFHQEISVCQHASCTNNVE